MNNLQQQLDHLQSQAEQTSGKFVIQINDFEQELAEGEIIHHALKTGDKIPNFSLPNALGRTINAQDFGDYQWLIISFYRGQWCPYCNLELRALEKVVKSLEDVPAKLLAISPQTPDNTLSTVEKHKLSFEVLSDVGNVVAKQFKIVYTVPGYLNDLYKSYGVDFQFFNGKGKIELPMPATYVIDREGVIRKHFVSTYAHERLDPNEVLAFLKQV